MHDSVRPARPGHLGIDVGGTFTDALFADAETGELRAVKVPSTRWAVQGVMDAVGELRDRHGVDPARVLSFTHGTTIAVNTLLERSGARLGLLTTRGFRDVLELRRLRLAQYNNFFATAPAPLIPRHRVLEVDERTLASGEVALTPDPGRVGRALESLLEMGIDALAISFLHAYRNPANEELVRGWIQERHPELYVCTSGEIWPQQREYERTITTVINGYVGARMEEYFGALEERSREAGLGCTILVAKSNGGVMSVAGAARRPVETLLSGPASGVVGAAFAGERAGTSRVIGLDMGGTSTEISVIDGAVTYANDSEVGEFQLATPAVDIASIGAGGGSIAWRDAQGVLKVGPRSAGALPGPACYGLGGQDATVTDAYLVAGIIHPERFVGGSLALHPDRARAAIEDLVRPLGLDAEEGADAILRIATSRIYAELVPQLARRGVDPADFSIVAYGGAGPTHVFMLARELGVSRVVVPPAPGLLCALGCLVADLRADFVRTVGEETGRLTDGDLRGVFAALTAEARAWLEEQGIAPGRGLVELAADLCHEGQSFEVTVPLTGLDATTVDLDELLRRFHDRYRQLYHYADVDAPVRLLEARAQAVGLRTKPAPPPPAAVGAGATSEPRERRRVTEQGSRLDASVHRREELAVGSTVEGPAVIEQYDTTTYVPPGFVITVDGAGNLVGARR